MPQAPKASHLSTVVQSELFDTDIEELSAHADVRRALFQSPRPPRVPLAKLYVRTRPSEDPTLQGSLAFWSAIRI
jgi:hypothetical protein